MKKQYLPLTKENLQEIDREFLARQKQKTDGKGFDEWSAQGNASGHDVEIISASKKKAFEIELPLKNNCDAVRTDGKRVKLLNIISPFNQERSKGNLQS